MNVRFSNVTSYLISRTFLDAQLVRKMRVPGIEHLISNRYAKRLFSARYPQSGRNNRALLDQLICLLRKTPKRNTNENYFDFRSCK